MASYRLGVLAGDGIGPEVMTATLTVLQTALQAERALKLELVTLPIGWEALRQTGSATPEATIASLATCHGWLLGPHDSASYPPAERAKLNPSGRLRKHFDLYANIRPARAYAGLPAAVPGLDLTIARENSEGLYADRNMAVGVGEFMPTADMALTVGLITRQASERIAHVAFRLARRRRGRVTIVHKANVLQLSMGLFRDACRAVAADYPDVTCDDQHIDAMTAHLVRHGADFDVLVTENMFGDILSDLAGELAGSLGLAGSVNAGDTVAMAQATHGAAPDIAGRGIANPVGLLQSTVLLLEWLGDRHAEPALTALARRIDRAVTTTLEAGQCRTPDLGGRATTTALAAAVVAAL